MKTTYYYVFTDALLLMYKMTEDDCAILGEENSMLCRTRFFLILSFILFMVPVIKTGEWGLIIGIPLILFCCWAIDWVLRHIKQRYLWITVGVLAATVVVVSPTVRQPLWQLFGAIVSFESGTLIVLSICFLFTHAVLCWTQPVPQTNST